MTDSQSKTRPDDADPREMERSRISETMPGDKPGGGGLGGESAAETPARASGGTTPNSPIDTDVEEAGEPAVAIEKAEEEALARAVEDGGKRGSARR